MPYRQNQVDALQNERTNDPLARGYSGMDDSQFLTSITTSDRTRNRTAMTGKEVKDRIDTADWDSRTDAQKSQLLSLFARDDLDPFGIDAHIFQETMTGAAGTSVADLNAYRVESITRAEELGLPTPTLGDVARTT